MRERAEAYLKWGCAVLGVLLLAQVAAMGKRFNPMTRVAVPEPATWAPPGATSGPPAGVSAAATGSIPGVPPVLPGPPGGASRRGGGGGGGPGGPGAAGIAPETQARIDRVVQSELLGPIIRPPPMALIGIAGKDVLLRTPDGQSGLLKEGGELGGVQLLRIGTNRVLVKVKGETNELTIFEGMGGESLLSPGKEIIP